MENFGRLLLAIEFLGEAAMDIGNAAVGYLQERGLFGGCET